MSRKIKQKWVDGKIFKIWLSDAPPDSPSVYDDEFNDESFDTSRWTEYDPASVQTISELKSGLQLIRLNPIAGSNDLLSGIYQSIPRGDFSITSKTSVVGKWARYIGGGLALFEDGSDSSKKVVTMYIELATNSINLAVYLYNCYNSWSSYYQVTADATSFTSNTIYQRIRRNGTTYYFDYSGDGVAWFLFYSGNIPFVPSGMGFVFDTFNADGGQPQETAIISRFFRYKNSDVGLSAPVEGNIVKLNFWI